MGKDSSFWRRGEWIDPRRLFLEYALNDEVTAGYRDACALPEGTERAEALKGWQERHGLTADWCVQMVETVTKNDEPPIIDGLQWEPTPFTFTCLGWEPHYFGWKLAEARFDAEYAEAKAAYREAIEDQFRALVWLDPKENRNAMHYVWAVRFQVWGRTYADIARWQTARGHTVTATGVGQEVRKVLKRVGLDPHDTSKGGRPVEKKPQS